jgi:hypothetical protein
MAKTIEELFKERFPNFDPSQVKQEFAPYMDNYGVNISDNTVTMEGRPESLPSRVGGGPSIPEITPTTGATRSWEETSVTPVTSPAVPVPSVQPMAKAPTAGPDPLDTLIQSAGASPDQDARVQMQEDERRKSKWGLLSTALGGAADTMAGVAGVYGANVPQTSMAGVKKTLTEGEKERKSQFEENLKNDPSSQISKHYQDVLTMIMGKKADDIKIRNLSASQISTTLPEIEKFMAQQLAREQVAATRAEARSIKQLAIGEKESQFREKQLQSMRQNLTGSDAYKNMQKIDYNGRIIEDAMRTPGAYADLATMFSFMKALDPQSVVREGEQERFVSTASLPTSMANTLNSWATGKTLQPSQRKEVADFTGNMVNHAKAIYKQGAKPTIEQATRLGYKLSELDPMFTDEPTQQTPIASGQLTTNEEVRVAKDGRKIVYDKTTKKPLRVYGE